jgi:hypothetical protein
MGDQLYAMVNWNDKYNSTGTIALKWIISPRKDFSAYHAGNDDKQGNGSPLAGHVWWVKLTAEADKKAMTAIPE